MNAYLAYMLVNLIRSQGVRYRIPVYDSIVTVVEPEISAFDLKMYVFACLFCHS